MLDGLAKAIAEEVAGMLRAEMAHASSPAIQPVLLTVKQAATYLGRSEQALQHLVFEKQIPVVRIGRRVHLDRRDLDEWISRNKY